MVEGISLEFATGKHIQSHHTPGSQRQAGKLGVSSKGRTYVRGQPKELQALVVTQHVVGIDGGMVHLVNGHANLKRLGR